MIRVKIEWKENGKNTDWSKCDVEGNKSFFLVKSLMKNYNFPFYYSSFLLNFVSPFEYTDQEYDNFIQILFIMVFSGWIHRIVRLYTVDKMIYLRIRNFPCVTIPLDWEWVSMTKLKMWINYLIKVSALAIYLVSLFVIRKTSQWNPMKNHIHNCFIAYYSFPWWYWINVLNPCLQCIALSTLSKWNNSKT